MRNISVSIDSLGAVTLSRELLGYSGEHNAVELNIQFSGGVSNIFSSADYCRVAVDGNISDAVYSESSGFSYSLPEQCMQPPEVSCQIIGYKIENGEPTVIMKSDVFQLEVKRSEVLKTKCHTEPDILEKTLEKCRQAAETSVQSSTEAQEAAETAVASAEISVDSARLASVDARFAKAEAIKAEEAAKALENAVYEVNNVSNALKGKASGRMASVKDVSPLYHSVEVKLNGRETYSGIQTVVLAEDVSYSGEALATTVCTECEPVKNYTVTARTTKDIILMPCVRDSEYQLSASVGISADYGEITVTYTFEGNEVSWNGSRTTLNALGEILSVEALTGRVVLSQLSSDNEKYFTGWGLASENAALSSASLTVTTQSAAGNAVNVSVGGKNLFDQDTVLTGYSFEKQTDGSYYMSYPKGYAQRLWTNTTQYEGRITLSWESIACDSTKGYVGFRVVYKDGTQENVYSSKTTWTKYCITSAVGKTVDHFLILFAFASNEGRGSYVRNMQIELGNSYTDFELYTPLISYPSNPEGEITVESVYPSMTVWTDADDVTVEVEYNRDINKAFKELQQAIISLGGNI